MSAWAVGVMALKPVGGEFETSSKDDSPCGIPVALSNEFSGGGYVLCCNEAFIAAWLVRALASSSSCKASWLNPCSKCSWSSSSLSLLASPFVFWDFRNRDPSSASLLSRFRLLLFDGGCRLLGDIMERVVIDSARCVVCCSNNPMTSEPRSRSRA